MIVQLPLHTPCWNCETRAHITDSLPTYLKQLKAFVPVHMNEKKTERDTLHKKVPKQGVYAFYRGRVAVYVGRSDGLSKRILEHSQPSTLSGSAPVATKIARRAMYQNFKAAFYLAKYDIRAMKVRAVEIQCPNVQAIFEVYAHVALGHTRYNDFYNR